MQRKAKIANEKIIELNGNIMICCKYAEYFYSNKFFSILISHNTTVVILTISFLFAGSVIAISFPIESILWFLFHII